MNDIKIEPSYFQLVEHYEKCFQQFGAIAKGVDWPNEEDAIKRLRIMTEITKFIPEQKLKLLDLGCGYGALFDYINTNKLSEMIDYHGVDLSQPMISHAQKHFNNDKFEVRDILTTPYADNTFDITIINGVFTEKLLLPQEQMKVFFTNMLKEVARISSKGFAFNVMSKHVDYEKDHLFHVSYDEVATILKEDLQIKNNYLFRADYGLYEFTTYVFNLSYQER